jgi:dual specificity tyrosine-phosphorylation-regulated kinase 2/3/4
MWSLGCILAELLTGFPLLPGEDEADQLACIIELLGMPPQKLLDASKRTKNFISSKGYPRYCKATTLPDGTTVLSGGVSRRGKHRGPPGSVELRQALKNCDDPLFVDFVRRCLDWDPDTRMTPASALRHGWLRRRLPRLPAGDSQSVGIRTPGPPVSNSTTNSNTLGATFKYRVQLSEETSASNSLGATNKYRVQLSDERSNTNTLGAPNKYRVQLSDDGANTIHSRHSNVTNKLPQIPNSSVAMS